MVPHELAGLGVERDDVGVIGGGNEIALMDRHVARRQIAGLGNHLGRQVAPVFPDQIAGCGVERLDLVGIIEDEQHAVMDDRRRLGGAGGHRPRPRHLEVLDVVLVDLIERAVPIAVIGTPPHQPIRRRWIAQHRVGDGGEGPRRIAGLLRECRRAREQQTRQSEGRVPAIPHCRHCFLPLLCLTA
jgi:hypothetical protein